MTSNHDAAGGAADHGNVFTLFMASRGGRIARLALGGVLVTAGVALGPPEGIVVAGAGVLPIVSGVFNLCPIAPLWGGHFFGSRYCPTPSATNANTQEESQ